jgi:hypothetical protein
MKDYKNCMRPKKNMRWWRPCSKQKYYTRAVSHVGNIPSDTSRTQAATAATPRSLWSRRVKSDSEKCARTFTFSQWYTAVVRPSEQLDGQNLESERGQKFQPTISRVDSADWPRFRSSPVKYLQNTLPILSQSAVRAISWQRERCCC